MALHTVILKQATPYMHSFPSQTVPMKRQAIEARALRILQGIDPSVTGVAEALVRVPNLKIPRLVFHDTEHNVLWMTDIGDGKTLTDCILSGDLSLSKIEDLAESLGTFIIGLYSATQNPGSEITSALADSQHLMEFLTLDSARIVQEVSSDWQKDPADTQLLLDRLRDVLSPDTNQDRCLGMVDFWPGNTPVLLTGELGLIDWEHFGLSDPGCELGLYVGHLHLCLLWDEPSREVTAAVQKAVAKLATAYLATYAGTVTNHFKRRFIIAHGRELINL
ncbi:hypothetical protein FRB90_009799 [Tulasnella sp. 427]|nr:hypothetical protein FRB90_009799 [Tulasnella sp. 427]